MNFAISTVGFLYCMYLIGHAMNMGINISVKNGFSFGNLLIMIILVVIGRYTLTHWLSDFVEWTSPAETPEDENKGDH